MPKSSRPTAEYIDTKVRRLEPVWSATYTRWKEVDQWYFQDDIEIWGGVPNASERSRVKNTRATSIIDHAVNAVSPTEIKVHREDVGRGKSDISKTSKSENAVSFIIQDAELQETEMPRNTLFRHLFLYDYAVLGGPFWDESDKPEKPEKRATETPKEFGRRKRAYEKGIRNWCGIRVKAPHPARVLIDPWEGTRPKEAFVLESYPAYFLHDWSVQEKERGGGGDIYEVTGGNGTDDTLIETIEYWSNSWHALKVKGEATFIFNKPNIYGFQPWKHCFGGSGGERTVPSRENGPLTHARGILWPAIPDLLIQSQEIATEHEAQVEAGWLRYTSTDPLAASKVLTDAVVPTSLQIEPLEIPRIDPWFFEKSAKTDRRITDVTYVSDAQGQKQPGVVTVGQQAIITNAVMRKFAQAVAKVAQLYTLLAQDIYRLVDVGEYEIVVRGIELNSKVIQGDYNCWVTMPNIDPGMQAEMRNLGMQETKLRLKSAETYRKNDLLLEDEAGEARRILVEDALQDPQVKAALAQEVLKKLGLDIMLEKLLGQATDSAQEVPTAPQEANPIAAQQMSEDQAAMSGAARGGM